MLILQGLALAENEERQFEMRDAMDPIIMISTGMVLNPLGYLASGADPIFASVFMSIPIPEISKYSCEHDNQKTCTLDMTWLKNRIKISPTSFAGLAQSNANPGLMEMILDCITRCIQGKQCVTIGFSMKSHHCILSDERPDQSLTNNYRLRNDAANDAGVVVVTVEDLGNYTELCMTHKTEPPLARIYRESMEKEIMDLWTSSFGTYKNLVKAYHLGTDVDAAEKGDHSRRKRNAAATAAVGIGGLALGGLFATIYEGFQTRKYIHRLEQRFNEFNQQTTKWMQNQVDFNEEIVKIYKSIHNELDELSCNLDIMAYQLIKEKHFKKWQELTKTILSGVLKNELTIGVLPEILTLDNIKELVRSDLFQDTIYRDSPEAIFTQGKLTLVNMTNITTSWRYHFILSAPELRSISLFNRYAVEQVGIQINGSCITLETPKEVYKIKDKFYEVTDDICFDRSHSLKICSKPSDDKSMRAHKSVRCLNKEEECNVKVVNCQTRASFTTAGVLAFSEEPVKGIPVDADISQLDVIGDPGKKTNFFSWNNYTTLLVGNRIMTSVRQPTLHIELDVPSAMPWKEFLAKKASEIIRRNLTNLVNIVEEQDRQLVMLKELSEDFRNNPIVSSGGVGKFLLWAGVASLVILFGAVLFGIFARLKYKSRKYKKQARARLETEMIPMVPIRYRQAAATPLDYSITETRYEVLDVQLTEDTKDDAVLDVTLAVTEDTVTEHEPQNQRLNPRTRKTKKGRDKIKSLDDIIANT